MLLISSKFVFSHAEYTIRTSVANAAPLPRLAFSRFSPPLPLLSPLLRRIIIIIHVLNPHHQSDRVNLLNDTGNLRGAPSSEMRSNRASSCRGRDSPGKGMQFSPGHNTIFTSFILSRESRVRFVACEIPSLLRHASVFVE